MVINNLCGKQFVAEIAADTITNNMHRSIVVII